MNSDSSKDPNISQAYRAAAQAEPGPQLDARILQAAHDALAKPAPKTASWSWLKLPIATLAVAVLATTVALQWRNAPQAPPLEISEASPPPALAMQAPEDVASKSSPAAKPAPQAPARRAVAPPILAERPPAPAAESNLGFTPNPPAPTASNELAKKQSPAAAPAPEAMADAQADAPAVSAAGAASPKAEFRLEAAPTLARERSSSDLRTFSKELSTSQPTLQQLDEIRKLKREGKLDAAKQALETLRKQFPQYKLPEDLRDLIDPPIGQPPAR